MPNRSTSTTSSNSVGNSWLQPETITGFIALLFLGTMGLHSWNGASNLISTTPEIAPPAQTPIQQVVAIDSATPSASEVEEASPSAVIDAVNQEPANPAAPLPSSSPATTQPLLQTTTTAESRTGTIVIARVNDTFWAIARRTCGQGVQGYRIKEENGYAKKHLHPGDEIVVTCN